MYTPTATWNLLFFDKYFGNLVYSDALFSTFWPISDFVVSNKA